MSQILTNPDDVPSTIASQLEDLLGRAIAAGATPPIEFMGAGMTAAVFCDTKYAYKVARRPSVLFRDEVGWLETAMQVPKVRRYVAKLIRWDRRNRVIVRECVRGRPGGWGSSNKVRQIWETVTPLMLEHGWLMPEHKEDSIVFDEAGNGKIVDAGAAHRISKRLLDFVEGILDGSLPRDDDTNDDLAFAIRWELGETRSFKNDDVRAKQILDRLYALGARR